MYSVYILENLRKHKHSAFIPFTTKTNLLCFTSGKLKFRLPPKEKSCVAETHDWHVCTDVQLKDQSRVCLCVRF